MNVKSKCTHKVTATQRRSISLFGREKAREAAWRGMGRISLETVVHYVGMVIRTRRNPKEVTNYGTFGVLQVVFHNLACCVL